MLPFAEQMLEKDGTFHPFAAVLVDTGTTEPITDVPDDRPDPSELLAHLRDAIRARSVQNDLRACALCADVKVVPPDREDTVDAVRVVLEHVADDEAVAVFRPYTTRRLARKVRSISFLQCARHEKRSPSTRPYPARAGRVADRDLSREQPEGAEVAREEISGLDVDDLRGRGFCLAVRGPAGGAEVKRGGSRSNGRARAPAAWERRRKAPPRWLETSRCFPAARREAGTLGLRLPSSARTAERP
jgi:hypothetical protein